MKFEEALDNVQRHYGKLFTLPELRPALVEAAAYAYGIVPTMLTKAQVESMGEELADKWDESGMTLSEKLHGVGVKMRGAIVSTLQEQMRRNKTWTEAARELYDGYGDDGQNVYNGGKDIISRQELPKYLQKVREATGNDLQALAEQRQAIDNINRLAKMVHLTRHCRQPIISCWKQCRKAMKRLLKRPWKLLSTKNPAMLLNVSPEPRWRGHGLMAS